MPTSHDPSRMVADERRRELATILAAGVLRLRQRRAVEGRPLESTTARLDVPAQTVLSGRIGLTAREVS